MRRKLHGVWLVGLGAIIIAGLWPSASVAAESASSAVSVTGLRCEYRRNPLGIDETKPRLRWRIKSNEQNVKQVAYRIQVATSRAALANGTADLWDSGKINSAESSNIVYQGKPLTSRLVCYWKVHLWCAANGQCEVESDPAVWMMGLLGGSDWVADYISHRDRSPVWKDKEKLYLPPAVQYRKDFNSQPNRTVRRATVYATALGIYELYLNGKRVSDQWFAPGWTDYHERAYYRAYDVTPMIKAGDNAIGAWLADGWYSGYVGFGLLTGLGTEHIGRYAYGKTPSIMAQLEIEYDDGTRATIATDKSWKVTDEGPIRAADFLMGESYDARLEQPNWAVPGFDDDAWQQAILAAENGHPKAIFYEFRNPSEPDKKPEVKGQPVDLGFKRPKLEAFPGEPVRIKGELKPVDVKKIGSGQYLYNLGQNFAGTIRLHVSGPAGQQITLRYGEMLYPDGRLMTENLRKARATDQYTLKGDANGETYVPRFTFHGFQYVELTASKPEELPDPPQITGLVLHSDTPRASSFECSDPMVNRLFKNIVWTQRANFIDLPTDCPQRDERMGWNGDAQVYIGTAAYNADVSAFYTKWIRELMESQRPSGVFPGYSPFPFQHGWDFGTAWADAGVICPWTIWQVYGDTRIIQRCWQPMTRFMQWRLRTSQDYLGVVHGNNWGDWLAQGKVPTPIDYIDTIYFAISTRMMAQMADAISHTDEARAYREQLDKIKQAFRRKYLKPDGSLTVNTQTAYALALFADVLPEQLRTVAGQKLADLIRANGMRMSTGFLGTRPLLPVLSSVGQNDLAVFLFQSRKFPSWGYEVEQGATTIWERWDSYTKKDGFGRHNAAMNSFSHYSFGAVCEWMFNTLAGIRSDGIGYKKIIIHPQPPAPGSNKERKVIQWVKASHVCMRGRIVSNWRIVGNRFDLTVEIPANTTGTVIIPVGAKPAITVDGRPLAEARNVRQIGVTDGEASLAIPSGNYRFASADAIQPAKTAYATEEAD